MPELLEPKKPLSNAQIDDLASNKTQKAMMEKNPLRLVCAEYLHIKTKAATMERLKLNTTQQKIFNKVLELIKAGKAIRIWLLKYRQGGVSTLIEAVIYALTSQAPNINSLCIADAKEHADNIFEMSKLYQEKLEKTDPHLPPEIKKSNEKKLEFDKIHSQIIIATGENTEAAKSHTFQYVHLSEVAFFRDLKTVLGDLNQTVPELPGTMVFGETTANGLNEFYKQWLRAERGLTDWVPMFFPWFEMDEYRKPLENGELYPIEGIIFDADSSVEQFLIEEAEQAEEFGWDQEQVNWRRHKIVNACNGDLYTFYREYPSTWQEAFAISGELFFNRKGLKKQTTKRPKDIGDIFYQGANWEFRSIPHGAVEIFEWPEEGEQYIVTLDASEGNDGDEAAALVLNKRMNSTAATVAGQYSPEDLARIGIALGNYYKNALVAAENKGYGYQVNQLIFKKYGNIYRKMVDKNGVMTPTDELGFNTTTVTRPSMLAMMQEEISHNSTTMNSKKLMEECQTFIKKKDKEGKVKKIEAQNGYQDGLVICRAIAGYVRNQYPYKPMIKKIDIHAKQRAFIDSARRKGRFGR